MRGSQTPKDWVIQRAQQFEEWRAAHPDIDARLSHVKAETAALATRRKGERRELWAKMCAAYAAQSATVVEAERTRLDGQGRKAVDLVRAGDWQGAERLYRQILETDPANVEANYGLGDCLRGQGDLAGASWCFSIAASFPTVGSDNGYFRSMLALQTLPARSDPTLTEPPVIFRVEPEPGELWDAPLAPLMTVIPGGEFTMGSLESEAHHTDAETPHRVTIAYPLAVSTCDVTRGEFAAFVAETGYDAEGGDCQVFRDGGFQLDPDASWRRPGFEQTDDEPVVCVNYYDGVAYAEWLTKITGHTYRLPSEAEWEHAVRGGASTSYYWGEAIGVGNANCDGCTPGEPLLKTTRGGMFPPNPFRLYDVCGNVWKWLADCWNPNYVGAPCDGSVWDEGVTVLRGRRGGSWFNVSEARPGDVRAPNRLRSAARFGSLPHLRFSSFGLRVVRDL